MSHVSRPGPLSVALGWSILAACVHGPPTVELGHTVRIATAERDTVVGTFVRWRPARLEDPNAETSP